MANGITGMKADRATRLFVVFLVATDLVMAAAAFVLAYVLRLAVPIPEPAESMRPFVEHIPMMVVHVLSLLGVFFFANLYRLARASRLDEVSGIVVGSTIGTLMGVALDSLMLRNFVIGQDYSRVMIFYAWLLSIVLVGVGRLVNDRIRRRLILSLIHI